MKTNKTLDKAVLEGLRELARETESLAKNRAAIEYILHNSRVGNIETYFSFYLDRIDEYSQEKKKGINRSDYL